MIQQKIRCLAMLIKKNHIAYHDLTKKCKAIFKLKQSLLLKLLGICHVCLTFENSNQIKLVQIASNWIRLIIWFKSDKIGSKRIKSDQVGHKQRMHPAEISIFH